MRNRYAYLIMFGMVVVLTVGAGLVVATGPGDCRETNHADNPVPDVHNVHEEDGEAHDDDHDAHEEDGEAHDDDHDAHEEDGEAHDDDHDAHEEDGDDHRDEEGLVEMTAAQQAEIGLKVGVAASGDIAQTLSLVGEVRLHEDRLAHLVPRVPGIAREVFASLGEQVRDGEVLATIDSPELAELKADYLEKRRHLELSRLAFQRKQYLKEENIVSQADWLEAQAALQNAETMLHSAQRRLALVGLGAKEIDRLVETGGEEAFGRYALTSPIAGTIIARHITRGEKIGEQEVFTVADLSVVWVDLRIPTRDLDRVAAGMAVEISSTAGATAEGGLTLIGPVVDRESRTVLGRVVLPNPLGVWRPGTFVKGFIQAGTSSAAVVVPAEAVQNIEGEDVVFVPDGHGFKALPVTLGKSVGDRTEILAGLKAGEPYVVKGAFALKAVKVTSGAGAHAGHGH